MDKFDGLALPVNAAARMTIHHPTNGQPLRSGEEQAEAYIELLSLDSDDAQKFERKLTTDRLARRNRGPLTADELEQEQIERLVGLTKSWRLCALDGAPLDIPCNGPNARDLYKSPGMRWLREQVETFVGARANFTKGSPTS
ncbi:MAG: hypothetical protein ACK4NA_12850 [Alphaproteobacteria bacterium]